ncbi:MAG: 16S rRNA (adenine(1518)-N(6)/adenine(1519)-N(6))-dimethyltransferase RsmA [Candidatus Hydrothermarchaeaceae archaeon]
MNLIEKTKLILSEHGVKPAHRLGQNFIVDESILERQVMHAHLKKSDTVLEIGPGIGSLTELLLESAGAVFVIERDRRMVDILRERFGGDNRLKVVLEDALEVEFPEFNKVVSNIPYGISSPLTFRLFKHRFELGIITYQLEFANRMVALPCTRDYSRISVAASYYADLRILEHVPKDAFYPVPEVDSALVGLKPRKPRFRVDEEHFFNVLRGIFSHRGKTLRKALFHSDVLSSMEKASRMKLIERAVSRELLKKRVFQLLPEEIADISNSLKHTSEVVRRN